MEELDGLRRGRDCTYDRPSIGVSYALWYHGKRTHDALRILAPRIARVEGPLRIVDLGCGTGATACAVVLAVAALERCESPTAADVVVDGVDSSPFMVEVAREVFGELVRKLSCSRVRATFRSAPWDSVAASDGAPTAIVGGYLLDHSDGAHADEIAQRLRALADTLSASSILLSTAASKGSQLAQVRAALEHDEWQSGHEDFELAPAIPGGPLAECHALRVRWYGGPRAPRRVLLAQPAVVVQRPFRCTVGDETQLGPDRERVGPQHAQPPATRRDAGGGSTP